MEASVEDRIDRIDLITDKREYEAGSGRRTRLGSAFMLLGDVRWAYNKAPWNARQLQGGAERRLVESVLGDAGVKEAMAQAAARRVGREGGKEERKEEVKVKAMLTPF